jgi:hypothetical protein
MKPYINTPMLKNETAAISLLREKSHSLTDSVSCIRSWIKLDAHSLHKRAVQKICSSQKLFK